MVVLSSPSAIKEIVDKNSWAANSRPVNYLAGLAAGGYHILFAADSMPIHLPIHSLNSLPSAAPAKFEKGNRAILFSCKHPAPSVRPSGGEHPAAA